MTSHDLFDQLAASYRANEWVVLPQLRDGTGWQGWRTADAVAMNCWPSRGMEVHGFELKISRSDWQRELKQPAKADSIFAYCDRFWLVVSDKSIVRDGELPVTWGLMAPEKGTLATVVPAPPLTPQLLDRSFIASILRNLQKCEAPAAAIEKARKAGYDDGVKAGHAAARAKYENAGEAWRVTSKRADLLYLEQHTERILKAIREELSDLKAWEPESCGAPT